MTVLRHPRFIRLFAALALAVLAALPGTPGDVSAQTTCGYRARFTFYAEPEKINVIGTCDTYCGGASRCTGSTSAYYTQNFSILCTLCP
ncbi:MAG TPA: hypothetical protein VF756_20345 [Thermoanaerobaculia bacterium]